MYSVLKIMFEYGVSNVTPVCPEHYIALSLTLCVFFSFQSGENKSTDNEGIQGKQNTTIWKNMSPTGKRQSKKI